MRRMREQELDWTKWLGSAAMGALAMYLLDPERGAPRRAQSGARLRTLTQQAGGALDQLLRRIGGSAGGRPDGLAGTMYSAISQVAGRARPDGAYSESASPATAPAPSEEQQLRDRSQAMRDSAMLGGGVLGLYGLMRRHPLAIAAGLAGLALMAGAGRGPATRKALGGATHSSADARNASAFAHETGGASLPDDRVLH